MVFLTPWHFARWGLLCLLLVSLAFVSVFVPYFRRLLLALFCPPFRLWACLCLFLVCFLCLCISCRLGLVLCPVHLVFCLSLPGFAHKTKRANAGRLCALCLLRLLLQVATPCGCGLMLWSLFYMCLLLVALVLFLFPHLGELVARDAVASFGVSVFVVLCKY